MKAVYKYSFVVADTAVVAMPAGAQILKIAVQKDQPFMWALVGLEQRFQKFELRTFRVAGTGHPIEDDGLTYIDSFMLMDGDLVFHVFEKRDA